MISDDFRGFRRIPENSRGRCFNYTLKSTLSLIGHEPDMEPFSTVVGVAGEGNCCASFGAPKPKTIAAVLEAGAGTRHPAPGPPHRDTN